VSAEPLAPRPKPCDTCPYRRDVPSAIWAAHHYALLPEYDRPTGEQPAGLFLCHQADGRLCAGWAGCHDMAHSLAARLALAHGEVDERLFSYASPVPLFGSGAEAAAHGMRDYTDPGQTARAAAAKLLAQRARRKRGR